MAILLIFTTYLYAMLYGEPEHAARIKCLDGIFHEIKSILPLFFYTKPLEMSLLFIYCASLP